MNDEPTRTGVDEGTHEARRPESFADRIRNMEAVNLALILLSLGLIFIFASHVIYAFIPVEAKSTGWAMVELWHHIIRDLGITAAVAGLIGVGVDFRLKEDFLNGFSERVNQDVSASNQELANQLREVAAESIRRLFHEEDQKREQLRTQGLDNISTELDWPTLNNACQSVIDRASRNEKNLKIRILNTWMNYRNPGLPAKLAKAAKEGCKVEILLLNPYSHQVTVRGKGLEKVGFAPKSVRQEIEAELDILRAKREELRREGQGKEDNLKVRLYDAPPVVHLYAFADLKLVGICWRKMSSTTGPQLEIHESIEHSQKTLLAKWVDQHFEDTWDDAKDLDTYDQEKAYKDYVRVTNIQMNPDQIDDTRRYVEHIVVPYLRKQRGFKGFLFFGDQSTREGMTITLWESEEQMDRAYADDDLQRVIAKAERDYFTTTPHRDKYALFFDELEYCAG
jgi:heme-degrading monooxygenase HmoA